MTATLEAAARDTPVATPGRGWTLLVLALSVLTLVAFAAAVVTGLRWNSGRAADSGRAEALAAAQQAATDLTTVDFHTAQPDVDRVLGNSTGEFADVFRTNADSFIGVLKAGEVVSKGTVVGAAVKDFAGDTADVLVALRATVTNKDNPTGQDRSYRMIEKLKYQDGDWLVSRVDFIP
ncbi:hypothetical protein [Pseudonocardia spinosispora]|uniref:hypothetical protein n=1 Tax=Pseudonocardia spinosispora TaxID=103441 RepID=UPI000428015C|nr:hypothetical protein [Pseudonocardia spinosispora]